MFRNKSNVLALHTVKAQFKYTQLFIFYISLAYPAAILRNIALFNRKHSV